MKPAFIALGSNLDNPIQQVRFAIESLSAHPAIAVESTSNWYGSTAIGPGDQPDYVNGVTKIRTTLEAAELLNVMQDIEHVQGRKREQRWSARTIDLDLLWYNGEAINTPELQVPHPRLCERNFVLLPLSELDEKLTINGKSIQQLAEASTTEGIWIL